MSAFLEAAIVGRPVMTFTLPEYRMHQDEMIHFQYLTTVSGGVLHKAPDLETHFQQLADVMASPGSRDERNRRFLAAFVRPGGLDTPATPVFVDALERLFRQGGGVDPSLDRGAWARPAVTAVAAWSRTGLGRWLMNDERADTWDERDAYTQRSIVERQQAKETWQRAKIRRKAWRQRRDLAMRIGKGGKSLLRKARHRTAVTVYRALYVTRLWRGELPGGGTGNE
jgi:hypothetical protein